MMRSGEQFLFSSAGGGQYSAQPRGLSERDMGNVQTFQPAADVFKGRSVRDIVQEQSGICAAVIHGCLFVTHQSWTERQIERDEEGQGQQGS